MRGVAVPLAKVLPTVRATTEGVVLDVKLKRLESGVLVYDVMVLSAAGEYRSIVVDAKRNRIIDMRQR